MNTDLRTTQIVSLRDVIMELYFHFEKLQHMIEWDTVLIGELQDFKNKNGMIVKQDDVCNFYYLDQYQILIDFIALIKKVDKLIENWWENNEEEKDYYNYTPDFLYTINKSMRDYIIDSLERKGLLPCFYTLYYNDFFLRKDIYNIVIEV